MTAPTATAEDVGVPDLGIIEARGRYFISQRKTTQRQDTYVWTRIEEADLEKLQMGIGDEGDIGALALGIIKAAYEKDLLYEIVGGLLTETNEHGEPLPLFDTHGRPQKWTVEKARELGDFVANLDEPEEKERFNAIINAVLILFFTTGVGSLTTSLSSSTQTTPASQENPTSSEIPRPAGSSAEKPSERLARVLALGDTDQSITASGTKPSESSPSTTPTP